APFATSSRFASMKPSRKKISRAASRMRPRDWALLASRRSFVAAPDSPASAPSCRPFALSLEDVVTPLVPVGIEQLGLDVALAEARDHDDDDVVVLPLGTR